MIEKKMDALITSIDGMTASMDALIAVLDRGPVEQPKAEAKAKAEKPKAAKTTKPKAKDPEPEPEEEPEEETEEEETSEDEDSGDELTKEEVQAKLTEVSKNVNRDKTKEIVQEFAKDRTVKFSAIPETKWPDVMEACDEALALAS